MPVPAGGSYYAEFITCSPSTGAAQNADSLPTATATHNGTDDGTFSLTVTNLDTGRYKVTGTVPAGYAAGDQVQVSVAATVNSIAGKGVIDNFTVPVANWNSLAINSSGNVGADLQTIKTQTVTCSAGVTVNANVGTTQPVNFTGTAGSALVQSDTRDFLGHAVVLDSNNYPGVNLVDIAGAAVSTSTAQLGVNVVNWVGSAPNALNSGRVDAAYSVRSGTAQAGAASTITLDAGASATNNLYQDMTVVINSGTGANQSRSIQSYVGSTKVATIFPNWATNPDSSSVFTLIPGGQADVGNWLNGTIPAPNVTGVPLMDLKYTLGTLSPAAAGYVAIDWAHINAPTTTVNLSGTTISTTQAVASVSGAVGSVTGNVGGNVAGSVGSVTGNVGGNVVGSVGSVVAVVSANVTEWGGTNVAGAIPPDVVFIRSGTAQAGGASSITLDAGASATNNLYQNQIVFIRSGTGAGQSAIIASYVGSTKVATIVGLWATNPDNTSVFTILPLGSVTASVSGGVNVTQWGGSNIATPNITGVPIVDLGYTRGTASAGQAGSVGIDWNAVANKTATVALTNTTISTGQIFTLAGPFKINQASGFGFRLVSSTDHVTPVLSATVTGQVSIAGAAYVSVTGTIAEVGGTGQGDGNYFFSGAAADFNGTSVLFYFTAAGADPVTISINTTP